GITPVRSRVLFHLTCLLGRRYDDRSTATPASQVSASFLATLARGRAVASSPTPRPAAGADAGGSGRGFHAVTRDGRFWVYQGRVATNRRSSISRGTFANPPARILEKMECLAPTHGVYGHLALSRWSVFMVSVRSSPWESRSMSKAMRLWMCSWVRTR